MWIYALNPNCLLYQPIKWQNLSPWQLISKSGSSFLGVCFQLCVHVDMFCVLLGPVAARWPTWLCVSGSVAFSRKRIVFLFVVHTDRLWAFCVCIGFQIHFHLFRWEIICTRGKTSLGYGEKRAWHPAREEKTQQSMLAVMTKNNGVLFHHQGSSIMNSATAALTRLYIAVKKSNWIFVSAKTHRIRNWKVF